MVISHGGGFLSATSFHTLTALSRSGNGASPKCPSTTKTHAKGGKLHPIPVLASLLPSKHRERLPPLFSSTFQCKDLANFFYE